MKDIVERLQENFEKHSPQWTIQGEAAEEIRRLRKEIEGWIRYKAAIDEALNSGDGSYRP